MRMRMGRYVRALTPHEALQSHASVRQDPCVVKLLVRRIGLGHLGAGVCERRLGRISGPLSSRRSPQAALKCSYRSDSVTRY